MKEDLRFPAWEYVTFGSKDGEFSGRHLSGTGRTRSCSRNPGPKKVRKTKKEGTISLAEFWNQKNVQAELERLWTERMGKEHKVMTNRYETLKSQVERLSQEIGTYKEENNGSAPRHAERVHTNPCGIESRWVEGEEGEGRGRGRGREEWNLCPPPIPALFHKPKYNTRQSTSEQQIRSHVIMT